uniref:Keratin-associated protein n=1 Tax=Panthera leo TaxID=9689 RepID=A0A8C9D1N4_PANLE
MSCHNCSTNYSLGSLSNPCHLPLTSSITFCSTGVSCGDVLCLPSNCQGHLRPLDNCQEACNEATSGQPAPHEPSNFETSCCPSTTYYVGIKGVKRVFINRGYRTSCLPITSRDSSSCHLASCRYPLSSHFPSYQSYDHQPWSYLIDDHQPWSYLTYGHQPLSYYMSNCYRPINYIYSKFQPYSSSLRDWQYPY